MKHCLAILCSSILFFICLGFGFVKADEHSVSECRLQEQSNKLSDDISSGDISSGDVSSDGISLSDISLEEISLIEQTGAENKLTLGDKIKLMLVYLKIKTGEYKDSAVKHVLQNQRKYIWGASAATIILILVGVFFLNRENEQAPAPKN